MNVNSIKRNKRLKAILHFMLIPVNQARPRGWVKLFVNPFFHNQGKGSAIRRRVRLDVLPFNNFQLGAGSTIEDFSTINNGVGDVIIGDNTLIGMGNVIIGPVKIGNNTILAQNIVVSGLNHGYQDVSVPIKDQKVTVGQITIGEDCWIGANAVITAGVTIGKHVVVAGGSVVTKNVPPYSVVAGNPARVIKQYNFELAEWVKVEQVKTAKIEKIQNLQSAF